jgi:hypothetical protein
MSELPDPDLVLLEPLLGPIVVASLSNEEIGQRLDLLFRLRAAADGRIVELLGEVGRRESYRDEGATATEPWAVERFGVSQPTARMYAQVAERAWDVPELTASLCEGEISLDKLRTVIGVATPETDRELRDRAVASSVRELAELTRLRATERGATLERRAEKDYELRSLRFNDRYRTLTAQMPPEAYAETKACLEARARELPSDGETPWDQRLCDAFLQSVRASALAGDGVDAPGWFVVAHVPLAAVMGPAGDATELAGDLERGELLSVETVRRIVCDATITIAVDDDDGHTMYEGRTRRDPTGAQRREVWRRDRHCRFPGCTNATFTDVHHIEPWEPHGRTDLDNLTLLCKHHHHRMHSKAWRMSGDANQELTFVGPTGRPMVSRPSPLWTALREPPPGRA